jgi:hypothetical protein
MAIPQRATMGDSSRLVISNIQHPACSIQHPNSAIYAADVLAQATPA